MNLPRMMIAFVVRRCTVELGHAPDAAEFALWANNRGDARSPQCLFGRPISEFEAHVILKHQARLVTARSAEAHEQYVEDDPAAPASGGGNVVSLAAVRRRLADVRRPQRR